MSIVELRLRNSLVNDCGDRDPIYKIKAVAGQGGYTTCCCTLCGKEKGYMPSARFNDFYISVCHMALGNGLNYLCLGEL